MSLSATLSTRGTTTLTDSQSIQSTSDEVPEAPRRLRFYKHVDAGSAWIGKRTSLRPRDAEAFPGSTLADAFARALCERSAVPAKELFEATETFALARKTVRRPLVADLCCGHGLAGVMFALMERQVERVLLVDQVRPGSAEVVLEAAASVAPWAVPKVEWREAKLKNIELPEGTGVIAVHACGMRTDVAMEMAIAAKGPFAALPCCRPHRQHPAPESLKNALGHDIAIDVHRTYALESTGYRVSWKDIAHTITPMNRVLIAARPSGSSETAQ